MKEHTLLTSQTQINAKGRRWPFSANANCIRFLLRIVRKAFYKESVFPDKRARSFGGESGNRSKRSMYRSILLRKYSNQT